jgi:hypothetical protein
MFLTVIAVNLTRSESSRRGAPRLVACILLLPRENGHDERDDFPEGSAASPLLVLVSRLHDSFAHGARGPGSLRTQRSELRAGVLLRRWGERAT